MNVGLVKQFLFTLLALLATSELATTKLHGQELGHFLRDAFSEENNPDATDPFSQDAGWLGKRFLRINAVPDLKGYVDGPFRNGSLQLNLPAPWSNDLFATVSQDFFVTGSMHQGKSVVTWTGIDSGLGYTPATQDGVDDDDDFIIDSLDSPQPLPVPLYVPTVYQWSANLTAYSLSFGTTVYVSSINGMRPFVRTGYHYSNFEFTDGTIWWPVNRPLSGSGPVPPSRLNTFRTSYHNLILNPGLECNLTDHLSIRGTAHLDTRHALKHTWYSTDLIYWPGKHWFVNVGGRFAQVFNDERLTIGTGVTF